MIITNPVGIDAEIQRLQQRFTANLFSGKNYTSHGRAFLNVRDDGIVPEVYLGSDEYEEVLLNDSLDAMSFFTVDPSMGIQGKESKAKVDIYFFCNLSTLFACTHRATEEVHILVLTEIDKTPFQVTGLVQGSECVRDFTIRNPELLDMQPFYCFKFECLITYKLC